MPIEGIAWDGRDLVLVAEGGRLYRLSREDLAWPQRRADDDVSRREQSQAGPKLEAK